MRAEMESQRAWRSEVWTEALNEETEESRKKAAEARAKKRSEGRREKAEVVSERRREREMRRKRRETAADWREVKRWTGEWPLRRGSASEEEREWWMKERERAEMRR